MPDPLVPRGDGHTEIADEDRDGLIPSHIASRADLFDAEQRNVAKSLRRRPPTTARLLDDRYLRDLHRTMLGDVWEWAGTYRRRETNIGIDPAQIAPSVRLLVDDARAWVEHRTFESDELAARFHHRLVEIHPFRNGNGRHGRIATDYLLSSIDAPTFTWGRTLDVTTEELRHRYRVALQRADAGDISELMEFCRQ